MMLIIICIWNYFLYPTILNIWLISPFQCPAATAAVADIVLTATLMISTKRLFYHLVDLYTSCIQWNSFRSVPPSLSMFDVFIFSIFSMIKW